MRQATGLAVAVARVIVRRSAKSLMAATAMKLPTILVPIDDSDHSDQALRGGARAGLSAAKSAKRSWSGPRRRRSPPQGGGIGGGLEIRRRN